MPDGVQVSSLFPLAVDDSAPRGADRWSVALSDPVPLAADELVPPLAALPGATATLRLVRLGGDATSALVDVTGLPDDFDTVVSVVKALFDPDVPLLQAGRPLHEHLERLTGLRVTMAPREQAYPHQVIWLPSSSAVLHSAAIDGIGLDASEALLQLLFKDVDIRYDPTTAVPVTPRDTSAPRALRVHVWDTMTVVEGMADVAGEAFAAARQQQMVVVNAQVQAARVQAALVRDSVLRLVDVPETGDTSALLRLRSLRQRLVQDVGVLASGLATPGGRPMLDYQRAIALGIGLQAEQHATTALLEDLMRIAEFDSQQHLLAAAAAQAERQTQLLDTSRAIRAVAVVFATVTVLLGAATLVAALAAIPQQDVAWVSGLRHGVVWAVGVLGAALAFGSALAWASESRPRSRTAMLLRGASVVAAVAAVATAVVAWHARDDRAATPAVAAMLGLLAASGVLAATGVVFRQEGGRPS